MANPHTQKASCRQLQYFEIKNSKNIVGCSNVSVLVEAFLIQRAVSSLLSFAVVISIIMDHIIKINRNYKIYNTGEVKALLSNYSSNFFPLRYKNINLLKTMSDQAKLPKKATNVNMDLVYYSLQLVCRRGGVNSGTTKSIKKGALSMFPFYFQKRLII